MILQNFRLYKPVTVKPETQVAEADNLLVSEKTHALFVVQEGKPTGYLTWQHIGVGVAKNGLDPKTATVRTIMGQMPLALKATQDLREALDSVQDKPENYFPVIDAKGTLTGILGLDDVRGFFKGNIDKAYDLVEEGQLVAAPVA